MTKSAHPVPRMISSIALMFLAFGPMAAGNENRATDDPEVGPGPRAGTKDTHRVPVSFADRLAEKEYRGMAPKIALRIDEAAASSQENAALLYLQALLARPEFDPCTVDAFYAVPRGVQPDVRVRAHLGHCLNAIELVQTASQMPQCDWGPMWAGGQWLDLALAPRLNQLRFLLHVDARTLASDGHHRAALARSLTIRRLANHIGDGTYVMYATSQTAHEIALHAITHVLSTAPLDVGTLTWLKGELSTVKGTPFRPAAALHKWRDAEMDLWRALPKGRAFTRELVLEKVRDANDRKKLLTFTDDQLQVLALQGERIRSGRYGISAPPELLDRAQRACNTYLESALQTMKSNLSYREKQAELERMVESLDTRASVGDPISLLSDAPRAVEAYYRFMVRNTVFDNILIAGIEICLAEANTGEPPAALPPGLPRDLFSNRDFEYERTEKGFVLRFDPENVSRLKNRQFEFRTQDNGS